MAAVQFCLYGSSHFLRRPDGNGRFRHNQHVAVHALPDSARHVENVVQVGGAVFVGRSADSYEYDFHAVDYGRKVGCKIEPVFMAVSFHHFVESRLVDGNFACREAGNFIFVDVDASHMVTHFGKTCAGNESHISCAYNRDVHNYCCLVGS